MDTPTTPTTPTLTINTWTFDNKAGRYRDKSGALVSWATVRAAVEALIAGAKAEATVLVQKLGNRPTRPQVIRFERDMRLLIAGLHRAASMAAVSGVSGILGAASEDLERTLEQENTYLAGFITVLLALATTIATPNVSMPGEVSGLDADGNLTEGVMASLTHRSQSYMDAALMTYERHRYTLMVFLDFAEGRRVLDAKAENCRGCIGQDALGWVPILELRPLGFEECGQYCHCTLDYRRATVRIGTLQGGRA
jgi:hypothetical protein